MAGLTLGPTELLARFYGPRGNAPGLPFPLQIEVAKFRRRIRFAVFGKVHDPNVRVAFSEHLHRVSQSVGRVLALS
jgi:hypothetical protein